MSAMVSRDYDVIDNRTGDVVLSVRNLWPVDPVECCVCGKETYSTHAVPYYCGVVAEGQSEGGYKVACDPCHDRWQAWNDSLPARAALSASAEKGENA